jgi:hypothetical protein
LRQLGCLVIVCVVVVVGVGVGSLVLDVEPAEAGADLVEDGDLAGLEWFGRRCRGAVAGVGWGQRCAGSVASSHSPGVVEQYKAAGGR